MEENLELNVFDNEFVRLGRFWERFAAYSIDGIILGIASVILNFIPFLGQIIIFLLPVAYFTYFYGTSGQTLGKKVLGLKVVRLDGSNLTYAKGFLRYVGYIVSSIILNIGFLMIGWDKKKQGLHDKIAGTVVIAKEKEHTILGVILFLVSFILPIILAVTIIIPNLIRAKNMAMQKAAQTSSQMPSEKYSSFPEAKEDKKFPFLQESTKEVSLEEKESAEIIIPPEQKGRFTKEAALKAITEIEEKTAKIKSYRVDFKSTAFHPDGTKAEKEGYAIYILPAKIKVDTAIKVDSFTQRFIAISDGKTFWQSSPVEKIVYAIDLAKLTPQAKEKVLASAMPDINIDITELKKAITRGSGRLKRIDNLETERIFVFEESTEGLDRSIAEKLPVFLDKMVSYISADEGLPKMSTFYDKEGKEFMTIFLNFSRINQITEDEFNLPSNWQVVDITDKFKQ